MKKAFTIVEILIACVLMTLVLTGIWAVWSLGDRSRGVTATARALQTATLIQEHLTNDLARLVSAGVPFFFDREKGRKLGFYVVDPTHAPPSGELGVRAVLYQLPGENQLLERISEDRTERLGSSPLKDCELRPFHSTTGAMVRVVLTVGRTKDDPDGPPYIHTFLVRPELYGSVDRLPVKVLSEFNPKPETKEGNESLPIPPGMFKKKK